jgi:hypothetical protein
VGSICGDLLLCCLLGQGILLSQRVSGHIPPASLGYRRMRFRVGDQIGINFLPLGEWLNHDLHATKRMDLLINQQLIVRR